MIRKYIILLCFLAFAVVTMAQDNHRVKFYNGTVEYKKPNALNTLGGALGAVGKNVSVGLEDKSIVPQLTNAISSAPASVYRLIVQEGNAPASTSDECYRLDVLLKDVMTYNGVSRGATANMVLTLIDLRTGKTVATKKTGGYEVYSTCTVAQGTTWLATSLNKEVRQFLWGCFPISGTIVQKGVEQENGTVKENQCYIDLAENYGAFEGMKLTVYDSKGKEIGSLKIKEVMGGELSACSISSGASKIEKALANGEKVSVITKAPK